MRDVTWAAAARDLGRLDRNIAERVIAAVSRYAQEEQGDARQLADNAGEWRLRVGDWPVIFFRLPEAIVVLRVVPRGRAYRD